ncbi:hypothetical protein [Pectinatus frisingensis]|uniref:hypothetical protein n=1 Tax=Pectinatus frisingensis TaxID=865 RepID=UPI0018C59AD9|nr:hypothetical protein [Pectinatus frisingensis]
MRFLMTQSLLNSYLYQFKCIDEYADKAHESFLNTLWRKPQKTTPAMQRGIDFEKLVYDICDNKADKNNKWYEAASKIAALVQGARRQFVSIKRTNIAGIDLLLYGRLDGLKAGTIYDIKFTTKYAVGKFYSSPQHPMYLDIVDNADRFVYLVSNGSHVWQETYTRKETKPIKQTIEQFFEYLKNMDLMKVYIEKWKSR